MDVNKTYNSIPELFGSPQASPPRPLSPTSERLRACHQATNLLDANLFTQTLTHGANSVAHIVTDQTERCIARPTLKTDRKLPPDS